MIRFASKISSNMHTLAWAALVALPFIGSIAGCSEAPKLPQSTQAEKSDAPGQPKKSKKNGADREESAGEELPSGAEPEPEIVDAMPPSSDSEPALDGRPEPPSSASPPPSPSATAPPPRRYTTDDGVIGRGLGGSAQPRAGATRAPSAVPPPPPSPAPAIAPPPEADKLFDVVPVFYGTDRTVEPDPTRLHYGSERGHKLQLGRAMITVPTAHKVPNIERPWVVEIPYFKVKLYEEKEDPAKHFTVQEIASLTKEQMLALVRERLATSAAFKDHAIVFVHGFNTSFDNAIYRTAQIAYDLEFDGAPFVYSWPSGGKVASYTYDRGSAEQAEPHLAEFLDLVVKESGAKTISLIAHSMGNELLLRVLERMRPTAPDGVVISQVIFAAPDVDRDKFTNIARQITDFAKGVTLYAASNDKALGYSARFWGGVPRAGDVPASGPLIVPGVDTIDVTTVSTDSLGLNHSGYAENKTLLNDIKILIQTGERPPDKRIPIVQRVESPGGLFWRYPAMP